MSTSPIFPRRFHRDYPVAVRSEGVYLFDDRGNRYLDACGGAAVVTIGHGVPEIAEAIRAAMARLTYAHSSQFVTREGLELAAFLADRFPGPAQDVRVHYTSGGSEATETAIKIARHYWLSRGEPDRYRIISRWQSYHGATLGALALSGNRRRREAFAPLLPDMGHIDPCFCYRCARGLTFPACELACANALSDAIARAGPSTVAAFVCEPIVGASSGAVPVDGYLARIREICDRFGILLIADEVLTGAGRTGRYLAIDHWGVVPDLVLLAKGLTSGYAPLGAVLVGERVWREIERGTRSLEHGFTYQGHPSAVAAGLAVQRYVEREGLVDRAAARGEYLGARLRELYDVPWIGDVRGKGLLYTVELVADRESRAPFPPDATVVERVTESLRARGILVYPMRGTANGIAGEHIMIAPPFVIEEAQIDHLAVQIREAVAEVHA